MAGHSHAANVAIRKGKQDRLRARIFSRLSKNIMSAARQGGDPSFNFTLRHAVDQARAASMPNDKIDHAIKKGAGLIEGVRIEELVYEGYGPGGVAMLIEVVTDKATRTRPELTTIMEKGGAKLASSNSVKFMFQRKGLFAVPVGKIGEEKLMELALDAGADDMALSGDLYEIYTSVDNFDKVRQALADHKIETTVAELKYLPDNEIPVEAHTARKIFNLIEKLEDHDDVRAVHTNLQYNEETLAILKAGEE